MRRRNLPSSRRVYVAVATPVVEHRDALEQVSDQFFDASGTAVRSSSRSTAVVV
jgi:hypothetical protein